MEEFHPSRVKHVPENNTTSTSKDDKSNGKSPVVRDGAEVDRNY